MSAVGDGNNKPKKKKLTGSRRCCIVGCDSHSRTHRDVKFFRFPDDPNLADEWLTACHKSVENIQWYIHPLVCSKHFEKSQVGVKRRCGRAVPSLNLDIGAKPVCLQKKGEALTEEQRLLKVHNDSVLEWVIRAQHHPNILTQGTPSEKQLIKIGTKIKNLLGPDLVLKVNDEWVNNFQKTYLNCMVYNAEELKKTLDLTEIINTVDPYAVIYSDADVSDDEDNSREDKLSIKDERDNADRNSILSQMSKRKCSVKLPRIELNPVTTNKNNKVLSVPIVKNEPILQEDDLEKKDAPPVDKMEIDDEVKIEYEYEYIKCEESSPKKLIEEQKINLKPNNEVSPNLSSLKLQSSGTRFSKMKPIKSKDEALRIIQLLDSFALQKENYRLIGFVDRLQNHFENKI